MKRYSDDEIRAAVRTVADQIGEPPTLMQYREHRTDDLPAGQTIRLRYDDARSPWLAALDDAGLPVDPHRHRGGRPTQDDVVASLRSVAAELGHWPSPDEYRDSGAYPSVPTIYDRFGSWPDAIDAMRDRSEWFGRLVDDGPQQRTGDESLTNLHGVRPRRASVAAGLKTATVLYLPGHTDEAVAEALFNSLPDDRNTIPYQRLTDELPSGVASEFARLQGGDS